jgi:toluene monooxygenase system protein B
MALFPLQGLFLGDFTVHLVPVDDADPMTVIAEKVAYHTVGRRLPVREGAAMKVIHKGQVVPGDQTVTQAGIGPMDLVTVDYA